MTYFTCEACEACEASNNIDGYSSIGRATVCGTVSSLFEPGYPSFS